MTFARLAARNVFRHRRRSIVTVCAVVLGFTAVSIVGGVVNNIFSVLTGQAISAERLGHLTFVKEGAFRDGKLNPEKYFWEKPELDAIMEILRKDPGVEIVTPRMRLFGLASNGKATSIFLSEAVVPTDDQKISGGGGGIAGIAKLDDKAKDGVVVGEELATMLGVKQGDQLTLVTQTRQGMVNAQDATIVQVYNTGNPATNDKFVLMPFELAQGLYDVDGADRLVVLLKDGNELEAARARLSGALSQAGHPVEVKSWNELSLFYEKVVKMFTVIFRVVTIVVSVVVLLALISAMISAVGERTAEIGTLRSMGLKRGSVTRLFATEGAMMGALGCLIGIPVVLIVSTIINQVGFSFIPPVSSAPVVVAVKLAPPRMVFAFVLFVVNAFLAAYFASRRAARLKIVDALGSH